MRLAAGVPEPCIVLRRCNWSLCIFLLCLLALADHSTFAEGQNVVLVGSGSSVPAPLYARWVQEYDKRNPDIQLRYLPVGTSDGIKQISHGVGDFAAGEAQPTEKDRKEGNLIELPAVLIGIVPIYNLPDVRGQLRLSGPVLSMIFLGDVKAWNASQIAELNPDLTLPSLPIRVINRPAGKGSNYVFTDFLSKVSLKFKAQVGVTPSPKWPVGESAERSSDMADKVRNNYGSIGYVEYQYALKDNVAQIAVQNSAGKFVKASNQSIAAACTAVESPRWRNFSASLTNAPEADSFPITSFSWIYVQAQSSDSTRAVALGDLLNWIYTDGQSLAVQEGYSELPAALLTAIRKKLKDLR
jgi:phosphate transport system substrate-binding protein